MEIRKLAAGAQKFAQVLVESVVPTTHYDSADNNSEMFWLDIPSGIELYVKDHMIFLSDADMADIACLSRSRGYRKPQNAEQAAFVKNLHRVVKAAARNGHGAAISNLHRALRRRNM
jgi:hypothetical protein